MIILTLSSGTRKISIFKNSFTRTTADRPLSRGQTTHGLLSMFEHDGEYVVIYYIILAAELGIPSFSVSKPRLALTP